MKLIICGSRNYNNYGEFKIKLEEFLETTKKPLTEIIQGGALGVDSLAKKYALEKGIDLVTIHANWTKYNKAAGPIRNHKMVKYGDFCIAFYNGKSRGTASMINIIYLYHPKKGIKIISI